MGPGNDFRLRIYGFTDLPPSLPLPRADLQTRNSESNYRRIYSHNEPPTFTPPKIQKSPRPPERRTVSESGDTNRILFLED